MSGVYIDTTHFYFYPMIKNRLKKYKFLTNSVGEYYSDSILYDLECYTLNDELGRGMFTNGTVSWVTGIDPAYIDQDYTFTINNGNTTTLRVDNTGNIIATGILHALGSVIFNTETNRLNYWDGDQWIEINQ